MPLFNLDFIQHIYDELIYLQTHSKDLIYSEFINDETLKRAFVRSLEIIGEASKKISVDFKKKYPEVDWRAMAGMRDKLIHDYFGIDYEIVWDVVKSELPVLLQQIKMIIGNESGSN